MKTENVFALIVVVLAPCLATVAQTTTTTVARPNRSRARRDSSG